jgi:hypothetical protein
MFVEPQPDTNPNSVGVACAPRSSATTNRCALLWISHRHYLSKPSARPRWLRMHTKIGKHNGGPERRESAEHTAGRMLKEELA